MSTLKRVLHALGTTLGEFFAAQESPGEDPGYVIRAARLVNVATGKGLKYLAPPGAGAGKSIQIMHEVYETGADTGPKLYVHEGEEAGFLHHGIYRGHDRRATRDPPAGRCLSLPIQSSSPLEERREGEGGAHLGLHAAVILMHKWKGSRICPIC